MKNHVAASDEEQVEVVFDEAALSGAEQLIVRIDLDQSGCILDVNDTFTALTGYATQDLAGRDPRTLQSSSQHSLLSQMTEVQRSTKWCGRFVISSKCGRRVHLDLIVLAVRSRRGALLGFTCLGMDVTEVVSARDELQRNGKLMQLGQLTATVAHEIRNPLGAIRTASFVLERKIRGRVEGVAPQLERINTGIQRCDKIITELLDISRVKALKRQQIAVDPWIVRTIAEDCASLPGEPGVEFRLGLGDDEASFDPDQLRQVVINLLSNAAEAMADKRKAEPAYRPHIVVSTSRSGSRIVITVADNGPGIAPENITRIREPLFTTKSFGVGLGIPAIERVLENHGGRLEITSVYGAGATIVVEFERGEVLAGEPAAAVDPDR